VAAPFIVLACLGFVFFGLTQETKTNYPMNTKRAIAYSLCTGIVLTGLFSAIIVIFGKVQIGLTSGFSAEEMFNLKSLAIEASPILTVLSAIEILFGLALLAYLILTQEKMQKPWVVEFARKQCQQNNSLYGERFGLICGAIWIAAFAIFLALCLTIGLRLSWLAFPCAIVVQLLVMARLSGDKRNKQN
jgi:hypothetical protein